MNRFVDFSNEKVTKSIVILTLPLALATVIFVNGYVLRLVVFLVLQTLLMIVVGTTEKLLRKKMICPQCGRKQAVGKKYCGSCGSEIKN